MRRILKRVGLLLLIVLVGAGLTAYVYYRPAGVTVPASGETAPVRNDGDAADDPAVWVHPVDATLSLVIGTDKQGGLGVYDLEGAELQYLDNTAQNNVDLRSGLSLPGVTATLVATSAKRPQRLLIYELDESTRRLRLPPRLSIKSDLLPQGICMYHSARTGDVHVIATGRRAADHDQGWLEQWRLHVSGDELLAERLRFLDLGGETEGCAADDDLGNLFVSEEAVGVWRFGAEPDAGDERRLIDRLGWSGHLRYNAEGIAIRREPDGSGLLIVSSQGSNDFTVYDRAGDHYLGRFRIGAGNGVDAVSHTDGLDVTSVPVGPRFPDGLFVAQDDKNPGAWQNFKLVSFRDIRQSLSTAPP